MSVELSPAGAPRERAVPCGAWNCTESTFNFSGRCDAHRIWRAEPDDADPSFDALADATDTGRLP